MSLDGVVRFTLEELSDATGVAERTIRYYIAEGLLPPAGGKGRSAYYTPEHVQLLTRIVELRNQHLSLDEVRAAMSEPPQQVDERPSNRWERIQLHRDLELFVRVDAPEAVRALADELQRAARRWLGADGA